MKLIILCSWKHFLRSYRSDWLHLEGKKQNIFSIYTVQPLEKGLTHCHVATFPTPSRFLWQQFLCVKYHLSRISNCCHLIKIVFFPTKWLLSNEKRKYHLSMKPLLPNSGAKRLSPLVMLNNFRKKTLLIHGNRFTSIQYCRISSNILIFPRWVLNSDLRDRKPVCYQFSNHCLLDDFRSN